MLCSANESQKLIVKMNSNYTYVLTEWGLGLMHLPLLLGCGSWDFLSATLHCCSFLLRKGEGEEGHGARKQKQFVVILVVEVRVL